MRRLVLIKQFYSIDVAHLYEHLYCMAVSRFFIERKLFQYVDYSLVGKTNRPGIVSIDLELYSDIAISVSKELKALRVSLKKEDILNVINQLLAEEEKPLKVAGFSELRQELKSIDDNEWVVLDDYNVDSLSESDEKGSLYVVADDSHPTRKFSVAVGISVDFAKNNRNILPLFHELSRIVIDNLQITLPVRFGCYSYKDGFRQEKDTLSLVNDFRTASFTESDLGVTEVMEVVQDIAYDILSSGAFEHYIVILQDLSYFNSPNLTPNFEDIYNDTHVLIGALGWKKIANIANMRFLLEHMHLEIKFESQNITRPLLKEIL